MNEMFGRYQKPLLKLANNKFGRMFLGIDKEAKDKIVGLNSNAYVVRKKNGIYKATFRCYPVFAKRLYYALASVNILDSLKKERNYRHYANLGQYQGLLNYCGLFEQPRLFPKIFLDSFDDYSGAGDGTVSYLTAAWNTAHDATTGTNAEATGTASTIYWDLDAPNYNIGRLFFPVNTSSIPGGSTTDSGTFKVTGDANATKAEGTFQLGLVQTTQPDETTLAVADYNNCGATDDPDEGASRIDYSAIDGVGEQATFTLNATGKGFVIPGSWTKLGVRSNGDITDDAPTVGLNRLSVRMSEYAGTTSDPRLEVVYTPPPSAGGSPMIFSGGLVVA